MVFVKSWDESNPAGSRSISLGDNDIRDFKYAIRERLQEDHNFFDSEAGQTNIGLHKKASFINQSDPTNYADMLILFAKDAGGKSELHSVHEDAVTSQLTYLGKLWVSGLKIASETNKDLIRHNGTIWTRFSWASFLAELQTDLNFGGSANSYSNLRVFKVSDTQVRVTADELTVATTGGSKRSLTSVSVTADITTSGANGLDTGAEANDTWYAVWVIYNGTTTAALLSTSFTAPTMPSGYTYKFLAGAVKNDSSGNFIDFEILGDDYWYAAWPTLVSGTTADVLTLVSTASLVPSALSKQVYLQMWNTANRLMISNLSTVSTNTTVNDANKFHSEPDEGAHFSMINIITADSLWWSSNQNQGTIRVAGFKINRR